MESAKYNISLIIANLLFALNFSLFVSVLEQRSLSLAEIFVLQNLLMLIVLSPWRIFVASRKLSMSAKDVLLISLIAIISSLGWSYSMLWGMSLTSPIDAATIAAAGPSLTLIFAHFMRRRRLTTARLSGVALSLLGVAILVASRGEAFSSVGGARGNVILAAAVVIAALNTLIIKPFLERYGVAKVAWCYALAASVVSLPLFWSELNFGTLRSLDLLSLLEVVALVILGAALPIVLLFEGTEYLSPLHTSLYRYLQPFVTSIVVVARHQATLSEANYLAFALILIGCLLVKTKVRNSME